VAANRGKGEGTEVIGTGPGDPLRLGVTGEGAGGGTGHRRGRDRLGWVERWTVSQLFGGHPAPAGGGCYQLPTPADNDP